MNRYYDYLRFFCNTPLDEKDKLTFLEEGGFAITTAKHVVSLYSAKTELIAKYENAFALNNGCICAKKDDRLEVYYNGNPLSSIVFDKGIETKVRVLNNAVALIGAEKTETVYFVSPDAHEYRNFPLSPGVSAVATSAGGMLWTHKKIGHNNIQHTLYDCNLTPLELPPFYRVDFLPCGSYIVHFHDMLGCSVVLDGCALYNATHERLLHTSQSGMLLQLGNAVLYQLALIIDPKKGEIISKYNGEKAVYGGLHIFTHEITNGMYSRLWVGGDMQAVMNDDCVTALYYWNDGRIYFAPQCYRSEKDDIAMRDYVSELYLTRVKEIMN